MNSTHEWLPSSAFGDPARRASRMTDDPRLIAALKDYVRRLESGETPDPNDLKSRHPELAGTLDDCLAGLNLVQAFAPDLYESPLSPDAMARSHDEPTTRRLGDFELLREIGRGGMGVVYEAVQLSLSRRVALKVLPFAASLDPRQIQRFKNEAQAAAYLHHANIVPIFGVGMAQGVHYYAMQFIEGQTLAAIVQEFRQLAGLCRATPRRITEAMSRPAATLSGSAPYLLDEDLAVAPTAMPEFSPSPSSTAIAETMASAKTPLTERVVHSQVYFRRVAQLGLQAAEALEHAHQLGVVHRDIKPANVLVDLRGNLWITDFGLATIRNSTSLTITGDLMGTLRYMSPEQALAKRQLIDHRTDIYSLGVTLYELACLQPAFESNDRQELLRQIAFEEPRRPRRVNRDIPTELETIIMKAMDKNVAERYPSAHELAEDLRRFLEDKPILAKRPTIVDCFWKWVRRHKALVLSVLSLSLLSMLGMAYAIVVISDERDLAKQSHRQALRQERIARNKDQLAQTEKSRAERNFVRLKFVVQRLLMQLEDRKWAQAPHVHEIRRAMSEQLLGFFQNQMCEEATDVSTRLEAGAAYMLMANVYRVQGDAEKSLESYSRAVDLFQTLHLEAPQEIPVMEQLAFAHHSRGVHLQHSGKTDEARSDFELATHYYGEATEQPCGGYAANNFAWFLVTCPQPQFRNPERGVLLAKVALSFNQSMGTSWNTLGVCYYRAGNFKEAVASLTKSMELGSGGDAFDWFFLAMANWQLGERAKANYWYDLAIGELEKTNVFIEPIQPFRRECEALLGVKPNPSGIGQRTSLDRSKTSLAQTACTTVE